MKKMLTVLLIVLFMSACQVQAIQESQIDSTLELFNRVQTSHQNISTENYAFYRPFHVGLKESGTYGVSLQSYNETIVFNVDVVGVLARELYPSLLNRTLRTLTQETPLIHRVGDYRSKNGMFYTYELKIVPIEDQYHIILRSYQSVLSARVSLSTLQPVLQDMITILVNTTINDALIISAYNHSQDRFEVAKQSENLFNQLAPETGTIADMINLLEGPPTLEELLRDYVSLPSEEIIEGEEDIENDENAD
ncbi:MAG: hypothetical protein LRY28_05330 [Erysipelotrichaceae bacterium]|nr:hypothetical protein [Erysipelotrichaceae bacterium]